MGRPLFSTLLAKNQPAVRVAEPEQTPIYERWSYLNAFDPDSDEDVVYEAFLTQEEIAARDAEAAAPATNAQAEQEAGDGVEVVTVPIESLRALSMTSTDVPVYESSSRIVSIGEFASPSDDSSTSESSGGSGRTSPLATDEPDLDASILPAPMSFVWSDWLQDPSTDRSTSPVIPDARLVSYERSETQSLPATPTRVWRPESDYVLVPPSSAPIDVPVPDSPVPRAAQAVSPPMTPPGSVTPQFLTWGGNRSRVIEIGTSPTPTGMFGSARSRISVNYISPPLRVRQ